MTSIQRKEARELFTSHGLTIAILSGYTVFCGDDAAELESNGEALLRNAELAADLQSPYVRTFLGTAGEFTSRGAEVLRRYCDKAKDLGVTVLMETHDSMKTGKQAAELLANVGSGGLAILWDIHHSITGLEQPRDTWQAIGQHIRHIHIKDADSAHKPCMMGRGVLPVPDIVQLLKRGGYEGFYSFEWEKTWIRELEEPEIALPHYLEYMKNI
jgi:sugar phosphate isomerase/epimerase